MPETACRATGQSAAQDDGLCPGTCNAEYRKQQALHKAALAQYDAALRKLADGDPVPDPPGAPQVRPWHGEPVWCVRCQSLIRSELAEIDDLASRLAAQPQGISPVTETRERVKVRESRSPESPSPAGDDLEEMSRWLRDWEAVAKKADDPRPRRGILASEITTILGWLYHHFDLLILDTDTAADFGTEVRRWHRELRARTHAASFMKFVPKPCPGCKRYLLWEKVGEQYVCCVNPDCSRRLTHDDLAAL